MPDSVSAYVIYGVVVSQKAAETYFGMYNNLFPTKKIGVFYPDCDRAQKSGVIVGYPICVSGTLESYNYKTAWAAIPEVSNAIKNKVKRFLDKHEIKDEPKCYLMPHQSWDTNYSW